ncbi:MAG: DUF4190 domain-containing protein [Flavobacteriales bacterium]|nr:DUF4190 domain-containing protein [Flavobacteriales bacterium]
MSKAHILPITFLVLLITSCSSSNDVVQKGIFQHRKYNKPGWFIDMPDRSGRAKVNKVEHQAEQLKAMKDPAADGLQERESVIAPLVVVDVELMELAPKAARTGPFKAVRKNVPKTAQAVATSTEVFASVGGAPAAETSSSTYRSMFSKLMNAEVAPPASDEVGGVNIFALLGFIFAFIFPIAGLVLSIIGLNKTKGGGNGHGLALAGLIISIVFLVVYGAVLI